MVWTIDLDGYLKYSMMIAKEEEVVVEYVLLKKMMEEAVEG